MKERKLGSDFKVSALGLGCMGMSEFYGATDDSKSLRLLAEAIERGITMLDTADMYGPHHNEELIGRFLATCNQRINIATKFGIVREAGEYRRRIDNRPDYARRACEGSLRRLGVEQIDLYYVHRVNPEQPIEETMAGLAKLVEEGKIARIGLSEVSAGTLRRAHTVHPVSAVQSEYSLWSRDVEDSLLPTCRELGVGFVAYSPLGRGFLSGSYQNQKEFKDGDFRANLPRFQDEAMARNRGLVAALAAIAEWKGCSTAQLSLAWVLAQGEDIVPIPGTRRIPYLIDNIHAVDMQLSKDELTEIDAVLENNPVSGERYTAEGMKGVNA